METKFRRIRKARAVILASGHALTLMHLPVLEESAERMKSEQSLWQAEGTKGNIGVQCSLQGGKDTGKSPRFWISTLKGL